MKFQTFILIVLPILLTVLNQSCQNKSNKNLDSSLINNPASASGKMDKNKMPVIFFYNKTHDFGKVIDGEKVSYSFKFTNTGKSDLLIANVIPSCGCTIPTFPKKPIQPGISDYINVIFDSKGKSGPFHKSVTVYTNTIPNSTEVFITGKVEKN